MENHLGHLIPDDAEVHHKDEDPTNNAISNLKLTTKSEHATHHKFWKKSPRTKPGKRRKAAVRVASAYLEALTCK